LVAASLSEIDHAYIECLNRQDWARLSSFVDDEVEHNGRRLRLSGYRDMLVRDFNDIPDLHFTVRLLVCEPPRIAVRLGFTCHPGAEFLGLSINGRKVSFSENVFYEFRDSRIAIVWSIIDKAAIQAQCEG